MSNAPAKAAAPKATAGSVMTSSGRWTLTPGSVISRDMLDNATAEEVVQEAYDWGMYESVAEQAFLQPSESRNSFPPASNFMAASLTPEFGPSGSFLDPGIRASS